MTILISNTQARHLFLARQGLSEAPNMAMDKQGLLDLIEKIGFVQVDSIGTVERAHHQILFSRNQTYRKEHLRQLLEEDASLFEHWTHDASIIPGRFYPVWKHRFRRDGERMKARWSQFQTPEFPQALTETESRIRAQGALLTRDFKVEGHVSGGWWNWHPNKSALEYLWRTGTLAIARRENFQKVYDLSERVIPRHFDSDHLGHHDFVDWCCREALHRLGFANTAEIAAFWGLVTLEEARIWVAQNRSILQDVAIETVERGKPRPAFMLADQAAELDQQPVPPARIRVLSPFDPLLRDRARAGRLFGFSYRIEVFVPEEKRQFGYYVFPLLEGDRMIGRIDMKAERKQDRLAVRRLWLEPGVRPSSGRLQKLHAELQRLARFTGVLEVCYDDGWLPLLPPGEKVAQ